jgi:ankyrin repeat/IBR domain-containing protein 1
MLESCECDVFVAGDVADPGRRMLSCSPKGHKYCVDCWSTHVRIQVLDNGLGCLPCPGYKCGELLHFKWAQLLLRDSDSQKRLIGQRKRHIIDCSKSLQKCPVDNCNYVVKINPQKSTIPQSAMCGSQHMFCIKCLQEAHSPFSCERLPAWHQLVMDEIGTLNVKGSESLNGLEANPDLANALWVAANTKRCPRCSTPIEKDEGCNHMR